MRKEVLKVDRITRSFGQGDQKATVLNGVSFTVGEGEFVAISGPSGCGKSTLLSIMGLLDSPDGGEYWIDGLAISELNAQARAAMRGSRIGFVFQSFNLIDEISVLDNVALPLKYMGQSAAGRQRRALECLKSVGMDDKAALLPSQLSGGQQQRVSIARALAGESGILLVDEPTGNLDSKNGDAVMALLQQLNQQGTTIVLVTHDPRYADMADRTIGLMDGVVVDARQGHDAGVAQAC
ncbi:ABC transporter ATP-binding protein [Ferrimonas pelagia]|uniref:ABC transporter ATP-binding protein n=1 Tax=Ferrimonas pelagia TaxID=1177826 RepID=A0ABP9FBE2_9GAMM